MRSVDPPKAAGNRELVSNRLAEARRATAARETVSVEWRGTVTHIDVISMPVDALYYNPETHRIRAQRSLDPERDTNLSENPWGEDGQGYLHELLRGDPSDPTRIDPEFTALKDDLEQHPQAEPGIITPTGIIVNGNTRRAALKELGKPDIRVGVLPDDWSWQDVGAVELSLQLRKELKRNYSFLNHLITLDEQVRAGRPEREIAKDFRVKPRTLKRDRWLFAFINEAVDRSKVEVEGKSYGLRLVDFERDKGQLEELYRAYSKLEAADPNQAALMREARLMAVVLDHSKTEIRLIEPDFYTKYLVRHIPTDLTILDDSQPPEGSTEIPGLDVSLDPPPPDVASLVQTTNRVLRAAAIAKAPHGPSPAVREQASERVASARAAFESSLADAGRDWSLKKKKLAAPDRLQSAIESIDLCVADLVAARAGGVLDADALDDALLSMRDSLMELASQVHRSVRDLGEGAEWLMRAATEDEDSE